MNKALLIGLVAISVSVGCVWQVGGAQDAYADCLLENYETGITRLFWSSQAAGRIPSNDDYYQELIVAERYCDPPCAPLLQDLRRI